MVFQALKKRMSVRRNSKKDAAPKKVIPKAHATQGSAKGEVKPSQSAPEQAPPLPIEHKPEETPVDFIKADVEPAKDEVPKEDAAPVTDAGEEPMVVASEDKEGGEEKEQNTAAESMDDEDDRIQKEGFNCCGITLQA